MVNKQAVLELADLIEASNDPKAEHNPLPGVEYDQNQWGVVSEISGIKGPTVAGEKNEHWCGTSCCIAGYWAARSGKKSEWLEYFVAGFVLPRVTRELGLTSEQAAELFDVRKTTGGESPDWKTAVKVLRHLGETDEVKWPKRFRPTYSV